MPLATDSRPILLSLTWSWLLAFIPTLVIAMRVSSTKHTLSDDALTTRSGITTKRTDVVELYRVKNVRSESNPFAGGKVIVTNSDGSEIVVRYVANADAVVSQIRAKVGAERDNRGTSYREHI